MLVDDPRRLDELFRGTNFGGKEADHGGRMLTAAHAVLQVAAGYAIGSTLRRICGQAGLIVSATTGRLRVTAVGHAFAYQAYSALERENEKLKQTGG